MDYGRKPSGENCGDYSCRICYYPISPNSARRAVPVSAPVQARIWLNVPYVEKEGAKAQGARWDASYKRWYAPTQEVANACKRWALPVVTPPAARGVQTSLGLTRGAVKPVPVETTREAKTRVARVEFTAARAKIKEETTQPPLVTPIPMATERQPREGHSYDELMAALGATAKPEIEYLTVGRSIAKYA